MELHLRQGHPNLPSGRRRLAHLLLRQNPSFPRGYGWHDGHRHRLRALQPGRHAATDAARLFRRDRRGGGARGGGDPPLHPHRLCRVPAGSVPTHVNGGERRRSERQAVDPGRRQHPAALVQLEVEGGDWLPEGRLPPPRHRRRARGRAVPEEGTRRRRVAGRQPHRQGDAAFPDWAVRPWLGERQGRPALLDAERRKERRGVPRRLLQQAGLAEGLGILRRLPRDPPLHVAVAATVPEHPADASEPAVAATAHDSFARGPGRHRPGRVLRGGGARGRRRGPALHHAPLGGSLVHVRTGPLVRRPRADEGDRPHLRAPRVGPLELWSVDAARAQGRLHAVALRLRGGVRGARACGLPHPREGRHFVPCLWRANVRDEGVLLLRGGHLRGSRLLRPRRHRRAGGGDDARGSQTPSTV